LTLPFPLPATLQYRPCTRRNFPASHFRGGADNPPVKLIRDIYAGRRADGHPAVSFEFFPLKTEEGERTFFEKTVPALARLKPDFASVTYGAGGGTRAKTLAIVDRLQRDFGVPTMAHLTCVGSTREQIRDVLDEARGLGIRNILALRGDPPGGGEFVRTPGGFEFAFELVQAIREFGGFGIGVAGFPEGHVACREGKHVDWERLRAKIDAGADFVVTQLFFDNADFFEFRDELAKHGVKAPVVPGIISVASAAQIRKFGALCGAKIPPKLQAGLDKFGHDDEATAEFGLEYATRQCEDLLRAGVPGLHFYTLNKARSATAILKDLGLR
jgi:methylenetetrahydrofolate reductase (NADPH)